MNIDAIEIVHEVMPSKPVNGSRVRTTKKITSTVKMCTYFKDMECRLPACDMKVCEKCPEGNAYCTRVQFIKRMLERVLFFFIAMLFLFD